MKNYIITEELASRIVNYLAGRPYAEVAQLMNSLSQMKQVEEKEQPVDKEAVNDRKK